ncbi:hypothetical protein H4582DRAFT_2086922 [Lactarius indigo]|nr:hypothetical protein H4582DRAFT_2086922 [Lactarius indigo]
MPVSTRASNADAHPGRIIMESQQTRRPRKQIEEDEARAKAVAIATRKGVEARHREAIATIATTEDSMEQDEEDLQTHSVRPDLRHIQSSGTAALGVPRSGSEDQTPNRPIGSESEDESSDTVGAMVNDGATEIATEIATSPIPLPATCVTPTSGRGFDELQDEFEGESEESEDFVPIGYAARKRAEKEKIGSLRSDINAARTNPHAAPLSKKHKEPVRARKGIKCCDAIVIGGFSTDWRAKAKHAPSTSRGSVTSGQANTKEGNNGLVSGAFHEDEPYEAPGWAKASKSATWRGSPQAVNEGSLKARMTAQVGMKLKRAAATMSTGCPTPLPEGDRKRQRKQRYSVADLPFPGGGRGVHTWRRVFLPQLHGWVGTQEDPFGANCQMEGEIVNIWKRTFPSVPLDQRNREIVLNVCDNALNNWRSDIGKAGYHAVSDLWEGDSQFSSEEDIVAYVSDNLTDLRFVYRFPDRLSGRGPFCSVLISKVYARHLRKISPDGGKYGPQTGGLALATVAVERALTLFKTGEDISKANHDDDSGRGATRVPGHGFTDNLWGSRARALVKSTQRLKDSHWSQIQDRASIYLRGTDHDEENGEDSGGVGAEATSLHAQIEIDWSEECPKGA